MTLPDDDEVATPEWCWEIETKECNRVERCNSDGHTMKISRTDKADHSVMWKFCDKYPTRGEVRAAFKFLSVEIKEPS